ncbi:MAG: error-prone DNA polymerase [Acidobacteria bacterium]|nr:error-prone DNA polymerase [Acidobacteriota bacterium]
MNTVYSPDQRPWCEWLAKTNFSFLTGASHAFQMVARAHQLGYRSLAINDFDGVYGLARTWRARQWLTKRHDCQLRLHYGAELHLSQDHDLPVCLRRTLALVAMNHEGYHNMCRLLTEAHRGGKHNAWLSLDQLLASDVTGLAAIQPMRGLIRLGKHTDLTHQSGLLRDHFKGRFYLAISRHMHPSEDRWLEATLALGQQISARFLMAQDAFFHDRAQVEMSDLVHAIRTNLTMEEAVPHMFVNDERCLHPQQTLVQRYGDLPAFSKAVQCAHELDTACDFDLASLRYHYPKEMIPEGYNAQTYLEKLTWEGAAVTYGDPVPEKIADVLRHELSLIAHLQFADYFLTVWDIVHWARQQKILCQGRGSAANSAVCFVLGVTAVDPSLFDLLFERFISVERGDPPDIDVDFEHERREEVIQYIYRRYGRDKAAMVANVITFRRRGAIRAVGKALGVPDSHLDHAAKLLGTRAYRGQSAEKTLAEVRGDLTPEEVPWEQWARLADRLVGFPRHLGIHSGGFVLSDKPINWLTAQEPATMEGRSVIQWCKDDIEALGFFKVDVLGLGMLTALRKCFTLIHEHYNEDLSLAQIPQGDPDTYAMIQRADTVGTFQIESRAQMSMLPRLKPRNFYDLVIEIAIIRPGPIQGKMIHPFLRRRYGKEPVTFPDPRLEPILKRTMGVPIFQEQVMRIAMAVGGFTPGEANELRRNIGSFAIRGDVDLWIPKLIEGMRHNGIDEAFIEATVTQLRGFASYGFPESHSASFAHIAYASCYLKRHYPAAFFASVLNAQPMGFYQPHTLIQTARTGGIPILPICVHHSDWDTTLEQVDVARGRPVYALRLGLRLVRCLSKTGAQRLLAQRAKHGNWRQLEMLLRTCPLGRTDLTALAAADAFAVFGIPRRAALWLAEAAPYSTLLDVHDEGRAVRFAAEERLESIQADFNATTTSLRDHPAKVVREDLWHYAVPVSQIVLAADTGRCKKNQSVVVFGMVIVKQSPPTANGMLFASIEDETGIHNLVITPAIYRIYRQVIEQHGFLCAAGVLQREQDAFSVMVRHFYQPDAMQAEVVTLDRTQQQAGHAGEVPAAGFVKERNYR